MNRCATFVSIILIGIVSQQSFGVEVNVTDKSNLCLYANLMVNFSVSYDVAGNKTEMVRFELPANVSTTGSLCGNTSSELKLNFGVGHSWIMKFTISGKTYQADSITFSYNLGDKAFFPNAVSNDTASVTVKPHITDVGMDTCYSCKSNQILEDKSVNQTLWDVLVQAFVSNNSKSEDLTVCSADLPTTTATPTTHATSTTTGAPVTNTTSTAPPSTTTPTPTLPTPTIGNYSIKPDENSTACLLAHFGLRIGLKQADKYQQMNLDPTVTTVSGSCGVNSSKLVLVSNSMTLTFTFTNDTKKFHLQALNVTGNTSSGVAFSEENTTLSLWEAAVSSSYMCNKEQNYTITNNLTLFTFNLQVQPFGVKKGDFSTAYECSMDDINIFIPVFVGAALAGLILIVVIAYVIGRRKTYVGYQTL